MSSLTEPRGEWALQWVPVQVREKFFRVWEWGNSEKHLCHLFVVTPTVSRVYSKEIPRYSRFKGRGKKIKTVLQHLLAWSESASALGVCAGFFPFTEIIFLGHLCVCSFPKRWVPVFNAASFWAGSCSGLWINGFLTSSCSVQWSALLTLLSMQIESVQPLRNSQRAEVKMDSH